MKCSDGRAYRIFIAAPIEPPPATGHPVLYLLDGNAAFDALSPAILADAPHLVLAGIGYETQLRFDVNARNLDYTPTRSAADPQPDPERPERMIGGGAAFLARLCEEILPEVEASLPVDANRRTIWGHSLGGLFVLYALLSHVQGFSRYAAASPSIWWGGEWLLGFEERTSGGAALPADVLVMVSDSERRSSPNAPVWNGPSPHTMEMIRRLSRRTSGKVSSEILGGLTHAQTLGASLPRAIKFAQR